MTRVVLDTNILLPVVDPSFRELKPEIRTLLQAGSTLAFASTVCLWEIAIKSRLGKLSLAIPLRKLTEVCEEFGLVILPILPNHVISDVVPEPRTRDPFDRLLLAQCEVENLKLLTMDQALRSHRLAWRPPRR